MHSFTLLSLIALPLALAAPAPLSVPATDAQPTGMGEMPTGIKGGWPSGMPSGMPSFAGGAPFSASGTWDSKFPMSWGPKPTGSGLPFDGDKFSKPWADGAKGGMGMEPSVPGDAPMPSMTANPGKRAADTDEVLRYISDANSHVVGYIAEYGTTSTSTHFYVGTVGSP